jgi:hypothetical protein
VCLLALASIRRRKRRASRAHLSTESLAIWPGTAKLALRLDARSRHQQEEAQQFECRGAVRLEISTSTRTWSQ